MKCLKCKQEHDKKNINNENGMCAVCQPIDPVGMAEAARIKKYFATLDEIFSRTGTFLIVDHLYHEHPELNFDQSLEIYAAWEELWKPADPPPAKTIATYAASIYVRFRETVADTLHTTEEAAQICQMYCGENELCLTITLTNFIEKGRCEPGCIVGLINDPRRPDTSEKIRAKALKLATELKEAFKQQYVSIVLSDDTVTIE